MRSPLPFPCVPDRPSKILLVQVGTLSSSHPSFGLSVFPLFFLLGELDKLEGPNTPRGGRSLRREAGEKPREQARQAAAASQNEAEESDETEDEAAGESER